MKRNRVNRQKGDVAVFLVIARRRNTRYTDRRILYMREHKRGLLWHDFVIGLGRQRDDAPRARVALPLSRRYDRVRAQRDQVAINRNNCANMLLNVLCIRCSRRIRRVYRKVVVR